MAAPYALQAVRNDEQIINYCTKYLARGVRLFSDSVASDSFNLTVNSENWRFPIVEPALDEAGLTGSVNCVTLVWKANPGDPMNSIKAIGSFIPWYESIELTPVQFEGADTLFYASQLMLPVGKSYFYRFLINGNEQMDPINPQVKILSNGRSWSYFFTDYFNSSEEFEEWEISLLYRLANQVVPFRSKDAQNFINRFYLTLTRPDEIHRMPVYKLDESVGEVNFITNILAKDERHHLTDYKVCLNIIDQILRKRNPVSESWQSSDKLIEELYEQMASGNVPDWDYGRYANPTFFLGLVRRHTLTGAFSHPRHGGNIRGVGWNYLRDKYDIKNDAAQVIGTDFNWQLALEKPTGIHEDYRG